MATADRPHFESAYQRAGFHTLTREGFYQSRHIEKIDRTFLFDMLIQNADRSFDSGHGSPDTSFKGNRMWFMRWCSRFYLLWYHLLIYGSCEEAPPSLLMFSNMKPESTFRRIVPSSAIPCAPIAKATIAGILSSRFPLIYSRRTQSSTRQIAGLSAPSRLPTVRT